MRFACDVCQKVFDSEGAVNDHFISTHIDSTVCEHCNAEVKPQNLKKHIKENCKKAAIPNQKQSLLKPAANEAI